MRQEKVIELLGPGHSFAEALMLTDQRYILNADALVSSEVLPVSKAIIAARLSLPPQYFTKLLHAREAERLIKKDKRDIHIVDAARLKRDGVP